MAVRRSSRALPLVPLTAWQALLATGKLAANQRVLIHARSGGVGSLAIQLARHLGATVFTTVGQRTRRATTAARRHKARFEYFFVRADGAQLSEIARPVEVSAITPLVDRVFPLERVRDALAYSESGRATGKVVITVA